MTDYQPGTEMKTTGIDPVGHCEQCRFSQTRLYHLDGKWYCFNCFPVAVDFRSALSKLENNQ